MRRVLNPLFAFFLALILSAGTAGFPAPYTQAGGPVAAAAAAVDDTGLAGLDEFIESVMKEWKVPGLALAVVKDGKVVLSKGYGLRNVEKSLPVTPRTLFAIGSISKSFTASVLGALVDDGKLEWDKPVRNYLPDFQLHDPVATLQMTPRDLVTHRSGLPRHDALWYNSGLSRAEMYERLKYLRPSKELREVFQYNNLMFMTAGVLANRVGGASWENLVRQKVFQPLGMSQSNFSVNDSQKTDDFAFPYTAVKDELKQIPFRNIDEIGPAGSINSSVEDMIKYVQFHIDKGKVGDKQVLSEANAVQMQSPQMVVSGASPFEELGHVSYGLGLMIGSYRGHKTVEHGGGIDGFISLLSFMPQKKVGMIVLTNFSGNNPINAIIVRNVYDRLLGLDQVDWVGRVRTQQEKAKKAEEETKKKAAGNRKQGTSPSHALADYGGEFENQAYGRVKVEVSGSGMKATFSRMTFPLKHYHYDIFEVPEEPLNPFSNAKVTFLYNKQGDIDRITVPLEPNVDDIVFTRVGDDSMRGREFLEPLTGEYELAGATVNISLRGDDTLTLTVPGQPTYELVPVRNTSFSIKGLSGFTVEFKKNASGVVDEVVFHQPNGTFVAKRK